MDVGEGGAKDPVVFGVVDFEAAVDGDAGVVGLWLVCLLRNEAGRGGEGNRGDVQVWLDGTEVCS
jgi:hypothetical protein